MKYIFTLIVFLMSINFASAASIKLEVDTLGQEYDAIKIYMANVPREFDFTKPIYDGLGGNVVNSPNLKHVTITNLVPGQTYKFISMLVKGDQTSTGSNIVQEKMPVIVINLKPPVLSALEIKGE